jgi:SAM-dependent methyltransferase
MTLVKNPLFARYFDRFGARREERGNRELRRELLDGLSGRVIEVGAGNGLNFPHYPQSVREVVAVEPEPYLYDRALEAAAAAPVPVRVVDGTAGDLPAADGEFDAVVVSGLLCSVTDVEPALTEFRRVLRPGGQLRFYEHVRSRDALFARYQKAADLIWPHLMGGCHVERRTQEAIARAFTIGGCRGFRFPPSATFSPVAPRIIGIARKADLPRQPHGAADRSVSSVSRKLASCSAPSRSRQSSSRARALARMVRRAARPRGVRQMSRARASPGSVMRVR